MAASEIAIEVGAQLSVSALKCHFKGGQARLRVRGLRLRRSVHFDLDRTEVAESEGREERCLTEGQRMT